MKRMGKPDVLFAFVLVYDWKAVKTEALGTQFLTAASKVTGDAQDSTPVPVVLVCKTARYMSWFGDDEIREYIEHGCFEPSRNMRLYEVELPD